MHHDEAVTVNPADLAATTDPNLKSWLESANADATDFPIQNLPLVVYAKSDEKHSGGTHTHDDGTVCDHDHSVPALGIAIGDQVVDLMTLLDAGIFNEDGQVDPPEDIIMALEDYSFNALAMLGRATHQRLRIAVSKFLRDGTPGGAYQPGMALRARYTLFGEGCRGHLGKQLEAHYALREGVDPQTYGLGVKELWEVPAGQSQPGLVVHTAGWPLDDATYGGGFVYHLKDNLVAIGYVVGLNYSNPWLSPFEEFQRYKTHPVIRTHIEGGRRLAYGARAIAAGGLQSLPALVFPGGALIGDDAGFLNAARIKGSHAAIKSGMLAADAAVDAIVAGRTQDALDTYPAAFRISWLHEELYRTRNFKPYMKKGQRLGAFLFGAEQLLFKGNVPWTLRNEADHATLEPAATSVRIDYPKPDGVLTYDRLSSVFLSSTNHEEDQPCHLTLKDAGVAITVNLAAYDSPEQRYCPAGVYEIVREVSGPRLQINAQNCVHCKTCDIKDPTQNINWVVPQGGEGPIYAGM